MPLPRGRPLRRKTKAPPYGEGDPKGPFPIGRFATDREWGSPQAPWEQFERPLAEPGVAVGRGWTSWNIPSLPVLDTARNGLLNVVGMAPICSLTPPRLSTTIGRGPLPAHLVHHRCPSVLQG